MTQLFVDLDVYLESRGLRAKLWVTTSGYELSAFTSEDDLRYEYEEFEDYEEYDEEDEDDEDGLDLLAIATVEGVLADSGSATASPKTGRRYSVVVSST